MPGLINRKLIPSAYKNIGEWPRPDISLLNREDRRKFMASMRAVISYAESIPFSEILLTTGVSERETRRMVTRCITPDGHGGIFGFQALVPHTRIKSYQRNAPVHHVLGGDSSGCAGALTQLFNRFPEVQSKVESLYVATSTPSKPAEARISYMAVHDEFKIALRSLGFTDYDWPFNTKNCGYKSLWAHLNNLRERDPEGTMLARSGIEAYRRLQTGTGFSSLIPTLRPYVQVQLDYHMIDAASVITLINSYGDEIKIPVARWYYGLLVERKHGLIIGYHIALESNPSGDSALEVIHSSLFPTPVDLCDPQLAYVEDGKVLPNQILAELVHQCFDVLLVDNAWANSATEVVNNIIDTMGCAVNFGPVRAWWRRALIERIFGALTRIGLQRLPSTYGSSPADTKRTDPATQAVRFEASLDQLIAVIKGVIREHNENQGEGVQFSTPLSATRNSLSRPASGFIAKPIPKPDQDENRLFCHVEECVIRGNVKKGIRPHINFSRSRLTNAKLSNSFWMIGKKVTLYTSRRDSNQNYAYLNETGEPIGKLQTLGHWSSVKISLRNKKLILSAGLSDAYTRPGSRTVQKHLAAVKDKLATDKKNRRKKAKASKAALELARLTATIAAQANEITSKTKPINSEPGPTGNYFGHLQTTLKPIRRKA